MQRSAVAYEEGTCVGEITCEEYGHTLDSRRVWWVPETKKKYLFCDVDEFVSGSGAGSSSAGTNAGADENICSSANPPQPTTRENESHFELYTGPVIHGGGFSF